MDDKARLLSVLNENKHLVLSTANKDGDPWVTPLAYNFDINNNLYWVSSIDSKHSTNIKQRKEVAIVIFMVEPKSDAIYINANAKELFNKKDMEAAFNVLKNRAQPDIFRVKNIDDVLNNSPWRIYKAEPTAFFVRELTKSEGRYITVRRKMEF